MTKGRKVWVRSEEYNLWGYLGNVKEDHTVIEGKSMAEGRIGRDYVGQLIIPVEEIKKKTEGTDTDGAQLLIIDVSDKIFDPRNQATYQEKYTTVKEGGTSTETEASRRYRQRTREEIDGETMVWRKSY